MKVLTTAGLTKLIQLCKNAIPTVPVTDVTVGGTSVVSSGVAVVPAIPTVNDSTITITQGGVTKGSFTLNQASGDTIALDAGSGGVTEFQEPTAQNNYIWYRKYADGWVEQGGTLTYTARQFVYSTITLPIQMANNHYTLVSEPGYTARSDTAIGQHVASRNGLKTTTTIFIAAYGNGADDLTDYIDWQVSGMAAS